MEAPEILINQKALTGESPAWDAQTRVLYWVDIPRATIFIYHPDSGLNENIDLSDRFQTIGTIGAYQKRRVTFHSGPQNCTAGSRQSVK